MNQKKKSSKPGRQQRSVGGARKHKQKHKQRQIVKPKVLLFYPNLVGYARIVATIIAFSLVFTDYHWAAFFYLLGQGLDAVDGLVARYFKQTSRFGAVLDMLTDRMSTATLLLVLALIYREYWGFFGGVIVLDIVSHWFQMYSKLAVGAKTHKGGNNPLLNFYYTFPYALLVFCVGNEFFLVCLYLLSQGDFPITIFGVEIGAVYFVALLTGPIFAGKQFMHVVQLWDAILEVTALDQLDHVKRK